MNAPQRIVATGHDRETAIAAEHVSVAVEASGAHVVQDSKPEPCGRRDPSAWSANPARARRRWALAILGHARRGLRIAGGSVRIGGEDMLALDAEARRAARRRLVAYVPQDPATALNPTLRIRTQLKESFAGAVTDAVLLAALAEVKLPATPRLPRRLSAPAFRWAAAAGGDRHGLRSTSRAPL